MITAHGQKAGQTDEMPVLHVAVAPTQITADEFEQRRRVLLPALVFDREDAHVVAGTPHQRCLDLVVTENMAAEHAARRQIG